MDLFDEQGHRTALGSAAVAIVVLLFFPACKREEMVMALRHQLCSSLMRVRAMCRFIASGSALSMARRTRRFGRVSPAIYSIAISRLPFQQVESEPPLRGPLIFASVT
jgi:hypothetical protein